MNKHEFKNQLHPILNTIIAKQTVSHLTDTHDQSNQKLISFLANWLQDYGFECTIQSVPQSRNKFNLIAHLDRGQQGIWLCGHSDTVAADLNLWVSDPWKLHEKDNHSWQGLGVSDMKGFIAQMMVLIQQHKINDWKKSLTLIITADEETTMAGARALTKEMIATPDIIFIGEPTANKPVIGHKGFVGLEIKFNGSGGHSSRAGELPDALMACHLFIGQLYQLREQWKQRYYHPQFELPWPTINPSQLQAGDSVNRVCSHATLNMEFRPTPGFPIEAAIAEIAALAKKTGDENTIQTEVIQTSESVPAYCCNHAPTMIETLSGYESLTEGYCTEAPFFNQFCSQVVVMGPGRIEQAHQANETLYFEDAYHSMRTYQKILAHYCL